MKRFRMKKQKVVKPDGRWLYHYTFEEIEQPQQEEPTTQSSPPAEPPRSS